MDANTKNKFSRQIGAVGRNTMEKLMNIKVLLIGGDMMGMEVTKCLSLIGIKELYILDNDKLTKKKKNNLYFSSETSYSLSENLIEFAKELNPSLITHKICKIDFEGNALFPLFFSVSFKIYLTKSTKPKIQSVGTYMPPLAPRPCWARPYLP